MSVGVYLDEHVESAIADGLRHRGVDVLTVQEDQMEAAIDELLVDRATELGRLLYTQDVDFLVIGARLQRTGARFAGIIFGRANRLSIGERIAQLELFALASTPGELDGTVTHLPI